MTELTAEPNVYGCHDPQCLDSTWDHECPVLHKIPVSEEGPLSAQDWKEIFSTVPLYPMDLPDELRRIIAQLAIDVREAAEHMERGRRIGSTLDYMMPMSLISGGLRRMEKYSP